MNPSLSLLIFAIFTFSFDAYCCRPSQNMKHLSFAEAFAKADSAFIGTIESVTNMGKAAKDQVGTDYKILFAVEKSWKGKLAKKAEVQTNSNTCNAFGQMANANDRCFILVDSKGAVMSGLGYEDASYCVDSSTPRGKELLGEYASKVKEITQRQ